MTILEQLREDHREAKDLLAQIENAEDSKDCGTLFREFRSKLLAHTHAEQKTLYEPMQRDEEHRDTILEATVEHQVAEDLIEQLSRARAKGTPEWRAKCTVLKEMLEHHIEEEEGEVFQAAREMFEQEQLEEMAQKFERLKERELKAA